MKILHLLLFLFISSHISAQLESGTVIYGVKIDEAEMQEISENLQDNPQKQAYARTYLRNLEKNLPFLEFNLTFNRDIASFMGKETMANDNGNDLKMISMVVAGKGVYFTHNNKTIRRTEFQNKLYRIVLNSNNKWNITKETKFIKGYKCFKATTETMVNNQAITTTAWFCPDLPFQYGPRGHNGLPGLILELNYLNRFLFYTKKLVLSKNIEIIEEPCDGELISEKEFDKMLDRYVGFFGN